MTAFPLLVLLVKMGSAATLVVVASLVAERSGPFIAAMIATLPISAGPALLFLALDHGDAFLSGAALGSMATNILNGVFCLVYAALAQRLGTALSLGLALLFWFAVAALARDFHPAFAATGIATAVAYAVLIPLCRPFAAAPMPRPGLRSRYAIPARAAAVAALVGLLSAVSALIGPVLSGVFAVFPIVLSSLIAILQPRVGGVASAAVIANTLPGLLGFGVAIAVVHLLAVPLGWGPALVAGLAASLAWNGALVLLRRRRLTPALSRGS